MNEWFRKAAHGASQIMGSPWAFSLAFLLVVGWALSGWYFNFSSTWQLFINTITTILTFLMVFLIQNTQNRDAHAIHLKLDELIKASKPADDKFIDVENDTDAKLQELEEKFHKLHERMDRQHPEAK